MMMVRILTNITNNNKGALLPFIIANAQNDAFRPIYSDN